VKQNSGVWNVGATDLCGAPGIDLSGAPLRIGELAPSMCDR
jgi:hypothetical protein